MELQIELRFFPLLAILLFQLHIISLHPASFLFVALCPLFGSILPLYIPPAPSGASFWCTRQRSNRQNMGAFPCRLLVLTILPPFVNSMGDHMRVASRPLVEALRDQPCERSSSVSSTLKQGSAPAHLFRMKSGETLLSHTEIPFRSAYMSSTPRSISPSTKQKRPEERRHMEDVVSSPVASDIRPASDLYHPSAFLTRTSFAVALHFLSGPSLSALSAPAPPRNNPLTLNGRRLSRRSFRRTSLSLYPAASVSPSPSGPLFSATSSSGRSRVSVQLNRKRAPSAEQSKSTEQNKESETESPDLKKEASKGKENQPEKKSTAEQVSSGEEQPAPGEVDEDARLPGGMKMEGMGAPDPMWTPRAEEITDDLPFGIARNSRYEQKLEMPPPLVPPNGSGFHREPVLPEHLYPHEVRCPPRWIAYGPHCVTLVTVPPWTTCPGDRSFRRHGLRQKMVVMSPGICAVIKETGVSLVCPKGYEPSLTDFPAFKEKDLEAGSADSTEPLGRAFTCTQTDSIPLEIRSGQPCPLGYSVSEFGTCEGQKHVGPSLSCPVGFDLGGEQVSPYVIRGKEYAKCGAVEYYKGKVWCPSGFVPLGLNLPNLPYGSSLDSFALTYAIKEVMESNRPPLRQMHRSKFPFQTQAHIARLRQVATELQKFFPPSFVDVLLANSLKNLNASNSFNAKSGSNGGGEETAEDIAENRARRHPMSVREKAAAGLVDKAEQWVKSLPHLTSGAGNFLPTERPPGADAEAQTKPLPNDEEIEWLIDFEEQEDEHSSGKSEEPIEEEGGLQSSAQSSPRDKDSTYGVPRSLQQGTSSSGEESSTIPEIYMRLQAQLPLDGGCAQVVAVFESHCDRVECQNEYMQKMKTHIFYWLDYRVRGDTRQIEQLIPSGKDYRYTNPG